MSDDTYNQAGVKIVTCFCKKKLTNYEAYIEILKS